MAGVHVQWAVATIPGWGPCQRGTHYGPPTLTDLSPGGCLSKDSLSGPFPVTPCVKNILLPVTAWDERQGDAGYCKKPGIFFLF